MTIYETITSAAKKDLLENKFGPMAYILDKNDKVNKVIQFDLPDEETKRSVFQQIGEMCCESGCHEIVIVLDCCMREIDPEESEYINENWDTEKPSTYPESMRKDMIVISSVNFRGTDFMKIISYEKDPEGVRITKENKYDTNFSGAIREALAYGFIRGHAEKEVALGKTPEEIYDALNKQFPNLKAEEN